jgi:hypothetical protein
MDQSIGFIKEITTIIINNEKTRKLSLDIAVTYPRSRNNLDFQHCPSNKGVEKSVEKPQKLKFYNKIYYTLISLFAYNKI